MKEIRTERGPRIVLKRNIQGASSLSQLNARSKSNMSRNGRVSYLTNTDSIISQQRRRNEMQRHVKSTITIMQDGLKDQTKAIDDDKRHRLRRILKRR